MFLSYLLQNSADSNKSWCKFIHNTILHTKLYKNCPRFIEDITKTFWRTFFLDTVYYAEKNRLSDKSFETLLLLKAKSSVTFFDKTCVNYI